MHKIRVLLAADHAVLRQDIRSLLQTQDGIEVLDEVRDEREVVEKTRRLQPDVVLMDLSMPLADGIEATRQITKEHPGIKVVVLTVHENKEYLFPFLKVGGSGFLLRKIDLYELMKAIESVYKGGVYLTPAMTTVLVKDYLTRGQEEESRWPGDGLTPREHEVLNLIAEGYTNEGIADLLNRSVKTIEMHRMRVMEKLNLHDRIELTTYAVRRGLIEV